MKLKLLLAMLLMYSSVFAANFVCPSSILKAEREHGITGVAQNLVMSIDSEGYVMDNGYKFSAYNIKDDVLDLYEVSLGLSYKDETLLRSGLLLKKTSKGPYDYSLIYGGSLTDRSAYVVPVYKVKLAISESTGRPVKHVYGGNYSFGKAVKKAMDAGKIQEGEVVGVAIYWGCTLN